jgi:hypothetical protein
MRPFLITSIAGFGVMAVSYVGIVREYLYSRELPSWAESLRITLLVVAVLSLVAGLAEQL